MKLLIKEIKRPQLILSVVLVIVLSGIGYYRGQIKLPNILGNRTTLLPSPSPTPKLYTQPIQWAKIDGNYAIFSSRIFMKRNQTQIVFPIKFEKTFAITWLGVSAPLSSLPNRWLISHPQLNNITWQYVNEGSIYLYKKTPDNTAVKDFASNPPKDKKILIDETLSKLPQYMNLNASQLTAKTNIEDYDYILTTFKKCQSYDSIIEYSNILDLTHAIVDDKQNISWSIQIDTTEDNPLYLGGIHVDYIQYDQSKQK